MPRDPVRLRLNAPGGIANLPHANPDRGTIQEGIRGGTRFWWIAGSFAIIALLVHFLTNGRYGYFRDELYFIACAKRLAWGYVDFAPLSALLLRMELFLLGDSLFAIRFLPALAHALVILLTGLIARELGGRAWAIALGCAATLGAAVYLANGNVYSMNLFEPLFWMGCVYLLLRIIHGGSPKTWLVIGLLAGLGFQNKHSIVFFGAALVAGLLLTPHRRQLAQPWIWLGGGLALLVVLPNLLWQVQHDWPTPELLRNVARSSKNVVLSPVDFVVQQILIMNPATLPLWLAGLVWLLVGRTGPTGERTAPYRVLGFTYLLALAIFILMKGKHYYLAPVYPMLFAAGGVAWERLFASRLRWLRPALVGVMLSSAAVLAPMVIPVLPPAQLVDYMRKIGFEPPRTETAHTATLPQLYADQFGWEEMTRSVAQAFARLSPGDQRRVGIFTQNYGEAGAIDFFGRRHGLPPALSGHQNYFLWGPRGFDGSVMLVINRPGNEDPTNWDSVEDLGPIESSPWAMPFEQRRHLFLCRGLKLPLDQAWPEVKEWL